MQHQHLPRQVQHNLRQTAMPVAWRAWDPAQFRMLLAQVRRSGADWSEERNMIVHMLRANHSAGSQAGRQTGSWLIYQACRDRTFALSWLRCRPRRRRRCQQEVCKPKTEAPRFIIKILIAQAAKRHITLKVHNTQTCVCVCACVGVELICSLSALAKVGSKLCGPTVK